MSKWIVSLVGTPDRAFTSFPVNAPDEESAKIIAIQQIKGGDITDWTLYGLALHGPFTSPPEKIWLSQLSPGVWKVSALSASASAAVAVHMVEAKDEAEAIQVAKSMQLAGDINTWTYIGFPISIYAGPITNAWVSPEIIDVPTTTLITIIGTPGLNVPFQVQVNVDPTIAIDGFVVGNVILDDGINPPTSLPLVGGVVIFDVFYTSGVSVTFNASYPDTTTNHYHFLQSSDNNTISLGDRYLWITTPNGLKIIDETNLATSHINPFRGYGMYSVTSLYDTLSTERVYVAVAPVGEGFPPGFIPTYDPINLVESDFVNVAYDNQNYIRARGNRLWKTVDSGIDGSMQEIDLTGNILSSITLSSVPAASTTYRKPYAFAVVGANLHVAAVNVSTSGVNFVQVDAIGLNTVRESTGDAMDSSYVTMSGYSGQVAVCSGSLWIGDAQNPPIMAGAALFSTDLTTYVTTRILLSSDIGKWTGSISSDGTILFAGYSFPATRFSPGYFTMARILPNGTIDTTWTDPSITGIEASIYDGGFVWVVVGFPAFFVTRYYVVQLDPVSMIEISRTFIYSTFSLFGSAASDIAVTVHGPLPLPPPPPLVSLS